MFLLNQILQRNVIYLSMVKIMLMNIKPLYGRAINMKQETLVAIIKVLITSYNWRYNSRTLLEREKGLSKRNLANITRRAPNGGGGIWKRFVVNFNSIRIFITYWETSIFMTWFFSQSIKNYEMQKAFRNTKICFSYQQSIGLSRVSCYLCQYSLFSEQPAKM